MLALLLPIKPKSRQNRALIWLKRGAVVGGYEHVSFRRDRQLADQFHDLFVRQFHAGHTAVLQIDRTIRSARRTKGRQPSPGGFAQMASRFLGRRIADEESLADVPQTRIGRHLIARFVKAGTPRKVIQNAPEGLHQ